MGAEWLTDAPAIARELNAMKFRGLRFEARQVPVAHGEKQGDKTIPMVQLHVMDRNAVDPIAAAVWLMRVIYRRHPTEWRWSENGIERLAGTAALRRVVEHGGVNALLEDWRRQSRRFERDTKQYWLYR